HGTRYNAQTLEITYRGKNIADGPARTGTPGGAFFPADPPVRPASTFSAEEPHWRRALNVLREVGVGYLRLGQPATELSGGEAQRIKLATELQRGQRGGTLYVLAEPHTGLHPSDVGRLMTQLDGLVESGNTVVVVEHDMRIVSGSDWVIDMGPGAGDEGGSVYAAGFPSAVAASNESRTAPYLKRAGVG